MSLWKIILNRYHTQKTFKKTERDSQNPAEGRNVKKSSFSLPFPKCEYKSKHSIVGTMPKISLRCE